MNIAKNLDQYNKNNVFFCEPIKNNVMNEGDFIRLIYSMHNVVLNGIYLVFILNNVTCEKYYTKYKCNFIVSEHKDIIENIKNIEEELLKKYEISTKIPQFRIYDHIKNGTLKIFTDVGSARECSFILKISGIWETLYNYGVTYKFVKCK